MNYICIGKDNMDDFKSVLYPGFEPGEKRITIGAYDDDGTIQGAVSFLLMEDQYDCDWLYVHPECRGKGVGSGLYDQIRDFIQGTGMIYPLSASFEVSEEDRDLYGFFLSEDDVIVEYSHKRFYVKPEQIAAADILKKELLTGYQVELFSELNTEQKKEVLAELKEQHCYLIQDAAGWVKERIPELDMVLYDRDSIVGLIFFGKREDNYLELSYLYSTSPMGVLQMLARSAKIVDETYPGYGIVYDAVNVETEAISRKIFPDNTGVCIYEAVW